MAYYKHKQCAITAVFGKRKREKGGLCIMTRPENTTMSKYFKGRPKNTFFVRSLVLILDNTDDL